MTDKVDGNTPGPGGGSLKIRLRPRMELDLTSDWRSGLFPSFANTMSWGVALPTEGKPIAFTDVGQREAEWVAGRLNRASYLETAVIGMLNSVIRFCNERPGMLLSPHELAARLADLYNETLVPAQPPPGQTSANDPVH